MLKLLTLNMEGICHLDKVPNFITSQNPDVICLQEMPSVFLPTLAALGYHTIFAPIIMKEARTTPNDVAGVAIATKSPSNAKVRYYYGNISAPKNFNHHNKVDTSSFAVIFSNIKQDEENFFIATTHLPVTADGHEDADQTKAIKSLFAILDSYPSHLLCGDMNMPRGFNTNYELFLQRYMDTIPKQHMSSLDRNLHRLGNDPDVKSPMFESYMVDYIFSQPPYFVEDVLLHFGVSDHAGVTATIKKS